MNDRTTTPLPALGQNPLQKAFSDYTRMEENVRLLKLESEAIRNQNSGLIAEVGMLREALKTSEAERIRLGSISSTLLGRLLSINDVIAGAVKQSIKNGIEAVHAAEPTEKTEERQELDAAGDEAQGILQRTEPKASLFPAKAVQATPAPPDIDWSRLPRG